MSLVRSALMALPEKLKPNSSDMQLLSMEGYSLKIIKTFFKDREYFYESMLIFLLKKQNVLPDAHVQINYLLDKGTALNFSKHDLELELKRFAYIKNKDILGKLYSRFTLPKPRLLGMITHASRHGKIAPVEILRKMLGEESYKEVENRLFQLACVMGNLVMLKFLISSKTNMLKLSYFIDVARDNKQHDCVRLLFVHGASNRLLNEETVMEGIIANDKKFISWIKESNAKVYVPEFYLKYIELNNEESLISLLPMCESYNKCTLLEALSSTV